MPRRAVLGLLAVSFAGALLVTCSSGKGGDPAPAARAAPAVSADLDVARVIRQVHFAFRAEGQGFAGGHASYDTRVDGGRLTLRAWHDERFSAPLTLETVHVGRSSALPSRVRGARVLDDGRVALDRSVSTERVANREAGVEQTWEFAARPTGTGALEVRVAAAGLAFVKEGEGALHFAEASGLGFRYGEVAWVDATGRRTPLEPRWDGRHVVLSVPAEVVDGSRYPAVLDPTVSPEFGLDNPVVSGAGSQQYEPSVASSGSEYLVAWQDNRTGNTQIWGTRVRLDGTVIDPCGIAIGTGSSPEVGYGSAGYFVVWYDFATTKISGARVEASTGRVLDSPALPISPSSGGSWWKPKLASDRTAGKFLVVWEDRRTVSSGGVSGTLFSHAGVVEVADIAIAANAAGAVEPAVASNGSHFLVVWRDARDGPTDAANIYGARVNPDGTVADAAGFGISTSTAEQAAPAVGAHGTEFLVAWRDLRAGYRLIYAARVTDAKQVLDPNGVRIYPGSS